MTAYGDSALSLIFWESQGNYLLPYQSYVPSHLLLQVNYNIADVLSHELRPDASNSYPSPIFHGVIEFWFL